MITCRTRPLFIGLITTILLAFDTCAEADFATLDSLANGGILTEGDTVFSNFSIIADIGTVAPDFSQVVVQTIMDPTGLEFQGNGQFVLGPGFDSIIFQIGFDVTTSGPAWGFSAVDLSQGVPVLGDEGLADVFNSISDPNSVFLTTTNAIIDPLFGINQPFDAQPLGGPQSSLGFETSFTLFADPTISVSLDSFRVTTSVPEPASTVLLVMLSGALIFRRRRSV